MKRLICLLVFCLFWQTGFCQGGCAIQLDKMNILISGIDNPITVAVYDTKESSIFLTTNNGKITGTGGHCTIRPDSTGEAVVEVWKKTTKGSHKVGESKFRVRRYPDPVLTLQYKTGGKLDAALARAQIAPAARWTEYYGICAQAKITGFALIILRDNKLFFMGSAHNSNSVIFSDNKDVAQAMESLIPGDILLFSEITARVTDGKERHLQPAEFLITDKDEKE